MGTGEVIAPLPSVLIYGTLVRCSFIGRGVAGSEFGADCRFRDVGAPGGRAPWRVTQKRHQCSGVKMSDVWLMSLPPG